MVATNASHQVRVEAYRGPLDLLLFLVRDEEVDIYDIPIAVILDRYLEELAAMQTVDINAAADFLVMAATLMEIKSRQLLPPKEREELELEDEDPRADLVRQLLEYGRFRSASDQLGHMALERSRLFGRDSFAMGIEFDEPDELDPTEELSSIEIFDLLSTFESLMKAILEDANEVRTIVYDDISVEERIEELMLMLRERAGRVRFSQMKARAIDHADAAGIFTAVLEATRRKDVSIYQPEPLGELFISLRAEQSDQAFSPSADQQPEIPPKKKPFGASNRFDGFMDLDEPEEADDDDFAFDLQGRKAISRLESAVEKAEQAVKNLTRKPQDSPDSADSGDQSAGDNSVVVHQWTDSQHPDGQAVDLNVESADQNPDAATQSKPISVRQWTDPDGKIHLISSEEPVPEEATVPGQSNPTAEKHPTRIITPASSGPEGITGRKILPPSFR
jgi:segregation and condensation protein A